MNEKEEVRIIEAGRNNFAIIASGRAIVRDGGHCRAWGTAHVTVQDDGHAILRSGGYANVCNHARVTVEGGGWASIRDDAIARVRSGGLVDVHGRAHATVERGGWAYIASPDAQVYYEPGAIIDGPYTNRAKLLEPDAEAAAC